MCNVRPTNGVLHATNHAPQIAKTTVRINPVVQKTLAFARNARTTNGLDQIASNLAVKVVWMAGARKQQEDAKMVVNQAFGVTNVMKLALTALSEHAIAKQVCQRSARKAAIQR